MSATPPGEEAQAVRRSFGERLLGALRLDASVFEEVEHDPEALGQAAGVVALAAVANAVGGAVHGGSAGLLAGVIGAFIGWALGTAVVWAIGVKLFGHTSDYPELLRTLGFASAPEVLLVLGVIPIGALWVLLRLAVTVLLIVAYVVAVRQALDVSTGRAVFVCVLAVLAWWLVFVVLAALGLAGTAA